MFAKEIEKIKELTEKLRQKGDVTEDEADWLYVVSFIPWKFWTDTSRKYKKINFSAPYDSIEELNNALEKWYSVVLQKAENQKTGNFLSTVFYIECRNDFRTQPKSLLKICQKFESCFKDGYIASDAFYSRIGHLLTGDMLEDPERGYLRFSRLRTIERIMDKEIVLARLCSFLETVRSVILSELNVPFLEKLRTGDNSVLLFPKEYDNIVRKVADIVKELPLFDSEGDCQKTALSVIKRENLKPFKTRQLVHRQRIPFSSNALYPSLNPKEIFRKKMLTTSFFFLSTLRRWCTTAILSTCPIGKQERSKKKYLNILTNGTERYIKLWKKESTETLLQLYLIIRDVACTKRKT